MEITKSFIMPPSNGNGTHKQGFDIYTIVLSVVSAGIIGCFGFLWNINGTMAKIQEHQVQEDRDRDDARNTTNQMQLDIRDLRDRAIRTERIQPQTQKPTL